MASVDAVDHLLGIFPFEFQFAGVSESLAQITTAKLFAEVGSQDTRFFTWRKVYPLHSCSMLSISVFPDALALS